MNREGRCGTCEYLDISPIITTGTNRIVMAKCTKMYEPKSIGIAKQCAYSICNDYIKDQRSLTLAMFISKERCKKLKSPSWCPLENKDVGDYT